MAKSCPINTNKLPDEAPNLDSLFSPVQAKILKFYDELRQVSGVITDKAEFEAEFAKRFATLSSGVAVIPNLKNYSKLENWFAYMLGWRSALWDATNNKLTDAGAIQNLLLTNAKVASNAVELMATYKSLPTIRTLYNTLKKNLVGIEETKIQELLHDHIIIGQFPKLLNTYDSPVAVHVLQSRYQKHIGNLQQLGLSPEDIKQLDILAGEISGNFDAARGVVAQYGMDVQRLTNGGYFPLQATEEVRRILKAEGDSAFGGRAVQFETSDFLNRARVSSVPAPLNMPEVAKLLGISELELSFRMSEPGELSKLLKESFSPKELDSLYEKGVLFEMPALSDELFSFFSDGLGLPIDNLGEAIQLDPIRAIQDYNRNLRSAVENASFIQTALETGVKEGWVLDQLQIDGLSRAERQNYVKIGTNQAFQDAIASTNLRESISEAFVHRTVADQLGALWKINVSVERLGLVAQLYRSVVQMTGFMKKSALMSTGGLPYLGRVFLQNIVSLNAATGNLGLFKYPMAVADVARVWQKKSLDVLSSKPFGKAIAGKQYSERELYEYLFLTRSTSFNAGVGENVQRGSAELFGDKINTKSFQRFMKLTDYYHATYGNPVTGKVMVAGEYIKDVAGSGFNAAYELLASGNSFLDFTARWGAFKAIVENPQKYAGRESWASLEEAVRYTDEYFGIQENAGMVGKFVGQVGIPFFSFAMQAPGNALRHAIRHPQRYGRMMLLYQHAQRATGQDLTDGELKEWQKDRYNVFLGRTSEGEIFAVNPGTVDYYLDTAQWAKNNFEALLRTSGQDAGSTLKSIDSRIDRSADFGKVLQDIANKSYWTKALFALAANANPTTGEKFSASGRDDTLLGIPMNEKTRVVLTELVPILRGLDRQLPTSIVGSPAVVDPVTGIPRQQAIPSWTGAIPKTGGTNRKTDEALNDPRQLTAWLADNVLSLNASLWSPEANLLSNYNDLGERATDISKTVSEINKTLLTQPNRPDKQKLLEERTRLLQIKGLIQYNQKLVDVIIARKGYTPRQAVEYLKRTLGSAPNYQEEALVEFFRQQLQSK